jgi:hypothetical protein
MCISAFKEAQRLGMQMSKTVKYANTGVNTSTSYSMLNSYVTNTRSMNVSDTMAFSAAVDLQKAFDSTDAVGNLNTIAASIVVKGAKKGKKKEETPTP